MVSVTTERERLAAVGLRHRFREEWGARFSYENARPVTPVATALFVHITVTNPASYPTNDAHARAVEAIGISRFPATGISYNELVLPGGVLYEAQPLGRRGAHTVNDRRRSTCSQTGCVSTGGDLTSPSWNLNVTARAIALARNIKTPISDLDVSAVASWVAALKLSGFALRAARLHGHRCVASKDCPGVMAWLRLQDIDDLSADYVRDGLPGAPEKPVEIVTPPTEDDMGVFGYLQENVDICYAYPVGGLSYQVRTQDDVAVLLWLGFRALEPKDQATHNRARDLHDAQVLAGGGAAVEGEAK